MIKSIEAKTPEPLPDFKDEVTHRFAVASKEGAAISEHFGHAKRFAIYKVSSSDCELLEHREVDHYCHGHTGDQSAMQKILKTIADCQAVFVAKIGDGPTDKLAAMGVAAVSDYAWEPIEASLMDYVAKAGEAA